MSLHGVVHAILPIAFSATLLTNIKIFDTLYSCKRGTVGIRKSSALDAFQLFYEELISSNPAKNRIRRLRTTSPSK